MTGINKIRIGESEFNIMPSLGSGLQFGTNIDNAHKLYINIGDAKADKTSLPSPGMKIDHMGFVVESEKFKEFLVALGFKTA